MTQTWEKRAKGEMIGWAGAGGDGSLIIPQLGDTWFQDCGVALLCPRSCFWLAVAEVSRLTDGAFCSLLYVWYMWSGSAWSRQDNVRGLLSGTWRGQDDCQGKNRGFRAWDLVCRLDREGESSMHNVR